jgi:hypothetical protein
MMDMEFEGELRLRSFGRKSRFEVEHMAVYLSSIHVIIWQTDRSIYI